MKSLLAEDADVRKQIDHRLEELVAQVDALTAELDRAIDDARDNAEYVDLVSQYRAERDAAVAECARLRENLADAALALDAAGMELSDFANCISREAWAANNAYEAAISARAALNPREETK
jgi:predicted transcriptional regulator